MPIRRAQHLIVCSSSFTSDAGITQQHYASWITGSPESEFQLTFGAVCFLWLLSCKFFDTFATWQVGAAVQVYVGGSMINIAAAAQHSSASGLQINMYHGVCSWTHGQLEGQFKLALAQG